MMAAVQVDVKEVSRWGGFSGSKSPTISSDKPTLYSSTVTWYQSGKGHQIA